MKYRIATVLSLLLLMAAMPLQAVAYVTSLTNGKYYRLHNAKYTERTMDGSGSVVAGTTDTPASYAQMWKAVLSGSTVALQNLLTQEYIQTNPGTSTQFVTGSEIQYFTTSTQDDKMTFYTAGNGYSALHCAATQSYFVVGWSWTTEDAEPSWWNVEEVTLTSAQEAELAEIHNLNTNASTYTNTLQTFFSDYACTSLRDSYASMTDAQLRSAMSALPSVVQEMAVRVKNAKWNSDATWNTYEQNFRIADYEIYSNCDLWYNKLKIGRFAHLFNPTGIVCSIGDVVYLYVDADPKDTDATLQVEAVVGTNRRGAPTTLKKGFNAFYVTYDCELFISYILNNVDKSCNDYPDIKIHIEGGTCNGYFDMHRGHTNSDWAWLKANMFQDKYLHVKGDGVLLNVLKDNVVGEAKPVEVMKVWDFIFNTLQTLSGCDQYKSTGNYKMMVNCFHNEDGGNPHWNDGLHGSSHPDLSSSGIFNSSKLMNFGTDGGQIWEIAHEIAHGHQNPINLAGQTESSNNSLCQCVTVLAAEHPEIFTSVRSSRGDGVKALIDRFNNGYSWIDFGSMRTQSGTYNDVWISNKLIFQLWLYFDYLKNYLGDSNTGFSFMTALYEKMRASGLQHSSSSDNPGLAARDWLLLAEYASEITQTDLTEFFQVWGFWELTPTVSVENDIPSTNTWFMGDYYYYYVRTAESYVTSVKNKMKKYSKKASNLMFIEDRCTGSTLPTYNNASVSSFGETGYYGTYDTAVSGTYQYTVSGTTVRMSGGSGAVGFKIYDANGNLVAIANTNSFTVNSTIANGLARGNYRLVAAQGDGSDVTAVASTSKTVTYVLKYGGKEVGRVENVMIVPGANTEVNMPDELKALGSCGDWMTYTYSPLTITNSTTTVTVTATYNGPIPISDSYDQISTWHMLRIRGDDYNVGYATYDVSVTPNVKLPATNPETDNALWALVGNPYDGFTIYNKAAGSSLKLVSDNPSGDGNTGGNTYATLQASGTCQLWLMEPSSSLPGYEDEGFYLTNADGYGLNLRSNDYLAYWVQGKDIGSTFTIHDDPVEVVDMNKAYTIHTVSRGYLAVKTGGTHMVGNQDRYTTSNQVTYADGDTQFHFAFVTNNGKTYLYSIGAEKFVSYTGELTTMPTDDDVISIENTTTTVEGYPYGIRFYKGTAEPVLCINLGGSCQLTIDTYGTTWGTFGEDGNAWRFDEAGDFDPSFALGLLNPDKEVTYNLVFNGQVVRTATQIAAVGSQPDASEIDGWSNEYVTFSYSPATITANTQTVTVNALWNGPFQVSDDYASAQWYVLRLKDTYYPTYVSGANPNVTLPTAATSDDTQRWAFLGNPYDGFTLINKAAGAGVKLVSDNPSGDGNAGGNTYATLQASGSNELWKVVSSTYATDGFFIYNATNGYALNQRSTANLAYWTDGADRGSTFVVDEVPSDWSERVVTDFGPYMDTAGQYFSISTEAKAALQPMYDAYSTSPTTEAEYFELKAAIESAGYKVPNAGRYRIKSRRGRYMTSQNETVAVTTDDATDLNTVITLTGEYPNFTITIGNRHFQAFEEHSQPGVLSEETGNVTIFAFVKPGYCTIWNHGENAYNWLYMHERANYDVVGWYSDAEASWWQLEDAALLGDVNHDGSVSIADVTAMVNLIITGSSQYDLQVVDIDGNSQLTLDDVTMLVNMILAPSM